MWFCIIVISSIVHTCRYGNVVSLCFNFCLDLTHVVLGAQIHRGRRPVHLCSNYRSVSVSINYLPPGSLSRQSFQRQLPIPSYPRARYLIFICCQCQHRCLSAQVLTWVIDLVAVLCFRCERNADALDGHEADTAGLIQARIMKEFVDEGSWKEPDPYSTPKRLAKIIDEYTPS